MKMRALVTGASGFLGRPCLARLVERGHDVLALSRRPRPEGVPKEVRWVVSDLNAADSYVEEVKAFAPQAAVHLAWEGIPDYGVDMSVRNVRTGCLLGDVLFASGCRHLAVSGSCWEYGKVVGVVGERDEPIMPGVFGSAKSAQRLLLDAMARASGATLAWGRVFYPYGPGQKAASLAPTLCRAALAGEVPLIKTPHAVNDFLYVDDTAEALVVLAESAVPGIFNIGSGSGTPVGAFADRLLQLAGRPTAYGTHLHPDDSPAGFWADTTALRALGWRMMMPLEEGLQRTLSFFRDTSPAC